MSTSLRATPEMRFWVKVERGGEDACWQWLARKHEGGYGDFRLGGGHVRAHRFSYELAHGAIPKGMFVLHRCDNPGCVNPSHLFLGTFEDNSSDMVSKGRGRGRLSGGRHK